MLEYRHSKYGSSGLARSLRFMMMLAVVAVASSCSAASNSPIPAANVDASLASHTGKAKAVFGERNPSSNG